MNNRRDPGSPDHDHAACLRVSQEAAVALLRRGEPSAEVRRHLEHCPPCRDEFVALAGLPRLLDAAREANPAAPVEHPRQELLDRLLDEVGRRRRRRRVATVGLVAAAAVAAVLVTVPMVGGSTGGDGSGGTGGGTGTAAARTSPSAPARTDPPDTAVVAAGAATDAASGADARVDVRAAGAGSTVSISVRGWPEGKPCRMIVHDAGGGAREVGIWTVSARDASTYVGDVDLPPATIARVELVDDRTGKPMIDVPLRRRTT